uniref:NADH-ubiquinone oxidoreductase chain 6 n=3 Tax=Shinisaurus crocodilurus TaxID=52224 RepID=E1AW54_SHICO|nr:NADH dehydrogenase subunit 6 [Shinisaurus crocodilurus]
MSYFVFMLFVGLVGGLVLVASNPSPYFGAASLVFAGAVGCGILVGIGGSFVALVLFLIYLGGMLVVFAYSIALASEPYPETWGNLSVGFYSMGYFVLVVGAGWALGGMWSFNGLGLMVGDSCGLGGVRNDFVGVSLIYSSGGLDLLLSGWGLMLTLFVVLELTRGLSRGGLRSV